MIIYAFKINKYGDRFFLEIQKSKGIKPHEASTISISSAISTFDI